MRRLSTRAGLLLIALALGFHPLQAVQLLPGVHGYGLDRGTNTAGFGSNSTVIVVDSLADPTEAGKTTLRDALMVISTNGNPRTVVFSVSGVINLKSNLGVSFANTTIAGQTAPFPGIAVHGAALNISKDNVLVQHLRIRHGDGWRIGTNENYKLNNRDSSNLSESGGNIGNVVFDHCTFMWGMDEIVECYGDYDDITFNKCIFAEGLNRAIHLDEGTLANDTPVQVDGLSYNKTSGTSTPAPTSDQLAIGGSHRVITFANPNDYIEYRLQFVGKIARPGLYTNIAGVTGSSRGRFRIEVYNETHSGANGGLLSTSAGAADILDQAEATPSLGVFVHRSGVFDVPAGGDGDPANTAVWVRLVAVDSGKSISVDQISISQAHGAGPMLSSGRNGMGKLAITNSVIMGSTIRNPWIMSKRMVIANNVMYNRQITFFQLYKDSSGDINHRSLSTLLGNFFIEGPSRTGSFSPIRKPHDQNGIAPNEVGHSLVYHNNTNEWNKGDWVTGTPLVGSEFNSTTIDPDKNPNHPTGTYISSTDPLLTTGYPVVTGGVTSIVGTTSYVNGMAGFVPQSASAAFVHVLADAGAFPASRDFAEQRIINEIGSACGISPNSARRGNIKDMIGGTLFTGVVASPGPGGYGAGGYPSYTQNNATWTLPDIATRNQDSGNGYTNLEVWLQNLAKTAEGDGITGIFDTFTVEPPHNLPADKRWAAVDGLWSVGSGLYRQTTTSGLGRSILLSPKWTDQAIESDVKLATLGTNPSLGVIARYKDVNNYYYLILKPGTSNNVEIRKRVSGTDTLVLAASSTIAAGTTYKLGFEVAGSTLKGLINDEIVLQTTDSSHASGYVGVMANDAAADFDNVAADPTPTAPPAGPISDNFEDGTANGWTVADGSWSVVTDGSQVYKQTGILALGRSVLDGTNWDDQSIQADVKPLDLDSFVGVCARYQNTGDYYYFILRSNDTIELKKLAGGTGYLLDSDTFDVTEGTWYTVKLEVVGSSLKAYINGQLKLEATDSTYASGQVALLTYKTTAEFDNVTADPAPGATAPEVNVTGNGNQIDDGATTPVSTNHTDFGGAEFTAGAVQKVFNIQNTGDASLTLGPVTVGGDFTLVSGPGGSIAPGGNADFTIEFNPTAPGERTATVSFSTNDGDENPYDFAIKGTGLSTISIFDDFEDGADGWTVADGSWSVVTDGSQVYKQTGILALGRSVLDGTNWDDQSIQADVKPIDLDSFVGVCARYQNTGDYYYFILRSDDTIELKKLAGGTGYLLDSGTFDVTEGTWYTVKLEVIGTSLKAYINGQLKLEATDSTYAAGQVALLTYKTTAEFDNVTADPDPVATAPEVNVTGNGNQIDDGAATPVSTNNTDFGSMTVSSGAVDKVFNIQNTGTGALTLGPVTAGGDFTLLSGPGDSIAPGGNANFTIRFDPSATGERTATVSFSTNDSGEDPYNFNIKGFGSSAPTMVPFNSIAGEDGRVSESGIGTGVGGSVTTAAPNEVRVGDYSDKTTYKGFLSFDTSSLPDSGITIDSAVLYVKLGAYSGSIPAIYTAFGAVKVDVSNSTTGFSNSVTLQSGDYQDANVTTNTTDLSQVAAANDWATVTLSSAVLAKINKTGKTQFRLRFTNPSDQDTSAEYLGFNGGADAGEEPRLEVTYH